MNHEALRIRDIDDTAASLAASIARGDTLAAEGDRAALVEHLRRAYAATVIAHERAASAAYIAEKDGCRGAGLAKYREGKAWQKRCAAQNAYRAAAK